MHTGLHVGRKENTVQVELEKDKNASRVTLSVPAAVWPFFRRNTRHTQFFRLPSPSYAILRHFLACVSVCGGWWWGGGVGGGPLPSRSLSPKMEVRKCKVQNMFLMKNR